MNSNLLLTCKGLFTLPRCTPRCVTAVWSRRTGTNRDDSLQNLSAFIYSRQCYGLAPVCVKNWSKSASVMLTVHSRVTPVALRCVQVRSRFPPDIDGTAPVLVGVSTASHGSRTKSPGVAPQHKNQLLQLITELVFAKYRSQITCQGKINSNQNGKGDG